MSGIGIALASVRFLGIWGRISSAFGSVFRWITASTTHLLTVALVIVVLHDWYGRHEAAKAARVSHSSEVMWQHANATNYATAVSVTKALQDQSAFVTAWAIAAQRVQKAAQDALRAAHARKATTDALADRIDVARAHSKAGGPCRTDDAVLHAKGEL